MAGATRLGHSAETICYFVEEIGLHRIVAQCLNHAGDFKTSARFVKRMLDVFPGRRSVFSRVRFRLWVSRFVDVNHAGDFKTSARFVKRMLGDFPGRRSVFSRVRSRL